MNNMNNINVAIDKQFAIVDQMQNYVNADINKISPDFCNNFKSQVKAMHILIAIKKEINEMQQTQVIEDEK